MIHLGWEDILRPLMIACLEAGISINLTKNCRVCLLGFCNRVKMALDDDTLYLDITVFDTECV